jgi:DNA-binding NtrC family response regulator
MKVILIVDDDDDLCRILSLYIRSKGFTTLRLDTIHGIEPLLQAQNPCLILLDNRLKDGLGINFIKILKERVPHTPVVLMTADHMLDLKESENFPSIEHFLFKPFSPDSLNEILERVAA